jgi:predicted nucleic acid-binding protein
MIFVDTSFWVAAVIKKDRNHSAAKELLARFGSSNLVTTNYIRGETWTFLRRREGHRLAVAFLDRTEQSAFVQVDTVSERQEQIALQWLRTHDEREYSFVDATSFAFMTSQRITETLAFDSDFSAAGFVELRP